MRNHLGSLEADFLFFLIRRVSIQATHTYRRAHRLQERRLSCLRDFQRVNGNFVRGWIGWIGWIG